MASLYDIAISRRTVRRFREAPIPRELLERCINAARLAPSGSNLQPLEYVVVDDRKLVPEVYACVRWAGYLRPHGDPPEGKRPSAYVIILKNNKVTPGDANFDVGEALENMMLVAWAEGVASCQFGSADRDQLRRLLNISADYEIPLVVAFGYPDETHAIEPYTDSPKYWRDKALVHHVPKRSLESIRHWNKL